MPVERKRLRVHRSQLEGVPNRCLRLVKFILNQQYLRQRYQMSDRIWPLPEFQRQSVLGFSQLTLQQQNVGSFRRGSVLSLALNCPREQADRTCCENEQSKRTGWGNSHGRGSVSGGIQWAGIKE